MENDPFNSLKPESDAPTEPDTDASSKKKKKIRRLPLLPPSEETGAIEREAKPKIFEAPESLWKKLVGAPAEEASTEPTVPHEASVDRPEIPLDVEAPMEEPSQAEQAEIAEQYIEARLQQLEYEQAHPIEGQESDPAEQAADIALLQAIHNRMRLDHESNVADHVEMAYAQTVATVAPEMTEHMPSAGGFTYEASQETVRASPLAETETARFAVPAPERPPMKVAETASSDVHENHTGSALLVGGAVGYLIGRRRGRINTEKEMNRLEKKMTAKVEALEQTIKIKEQQIRAVVREKLSPPATRLSETMPREAVPAKEMLGLVSLKAMEATTLKPISRTEKPVVKKLAPEKAVAARTMPRNELLILSEKIEVGATNLRRVYETNLISEQSLRRLVEAKGQGGDVREMLEREMVEKEMSYERDPRLRNRGAVGSLAAAGAVKVLDDSGLSSSVQQKVEADRKKSKSALNATTVGGAKPHQPVAAYVTVLTLIFIISLLLYLLFTSKQ